MLRIGLSIAGAEFLHDLTITVDSVGRIQLKETPSPAKGSIDVRAYVRAIQTDLLRLRPALPATADPSMAWAEYSDSPYRPIASVSLPGSVQKIDRLLRMAFGCGMDGYLAVLGTAVSWSGARDDVAEVRREQLRDAAVQWSGLAAEEIEHAIGRLVLSGKQLRSEEMLFWEQELRRYRLVTRPLVELPTGALLLIPRRIEATQVVYANYLTDGRWPVPPFEVPPKLRDALVEFRQVTNRELEREAVAVAISLGWPLVANLDPSDAAGAGVLLSGEVDLITADVGRRRIWVCEVKDQSAAFSPSIISRRARKFLQAGGYVDKLLRSATSVQGQIAGVLDMLGLNRPVTNWQVLPLMVTRRVEPAGFASGLTVSFVVIRDLATTLQSEQSPKPGHVPIGDTWLL